MPGTGRAESGIELEKLPALTEKRFTWIRRAVATFRRLASRSIEFVSEPVKETLPFT